MPAKRKYSEEIKQETRDYWRQGRENFTPGEKQHGYYTLKDIEEMTGIDRKVCWMIATGKR